MSDDFTNTWLKVMKNPGTFFEQMPTNGGYVAPIGFAAICNLIASAIGFINRFLSAGANMTMDMFTMELISMMIVPLLIGVIGLFIGGSILHIFFKIFGGKGTYESTIRLLAYSNAAIALSWTLFPFVAILAYLYMIYLAAMGGIKVHKLSVLRSTIAVAVSVVVVIIVVLIVAVGLFLYITSH